MKTEKFEQKHKTSTAKQLETKFTVHFYFVLYKFECLNISMSMY